MIVDVVGVYDDHDHDDRYNTKAQTDAALSSKADSSNVYTKAQTDAALTTKANTSDIYTKTQTDAAIAAAATGFDRIVVVSGAGTDLDNGTALLAAINTVDLATPSAADPWTIMLEPGVYATTVPVVLSTGVSLIGTNQNGTTVTCACVSASNGVVTVNGTSTVSGLSISNTSLDSTNARGLFVDGSDVLIDHVTITTVGDDGIDVDTNVIDVRVESVEVFAADAAIDAGVSTAIRINNSYLSSQGFEVLQLSSGALSATVTNSTIEQLDASDTGINIQGTTTPVVLEISNSRIITNGSPAWLENASNTATIYVSNSYIYAGTKIGAGAAVPVCVLIAGPATGSLSSCP